MNFPAFSHRVTCYLCNVWGFVYLEGFSGTPGYVSPEMVNRESYGRPVDVWACGELFWLFVGTM